MNHTAYVLTEPERLASGAVFASPHSGRDYPAAFLRRSRLDALAIRSSEDAFVDILLEAAPAAGAPLLAARMPRAYIDFNRGVDELDPVLIEGVEARGHNPRVAAGLGVIPRVVANGRAIYRGRLSRREALERIDAHHRPYHACLRGLVQRAAATFGQAILFDVHSMPHEALASFGHPRVARPEIILGDRFGASATPALSSEVEAIFRDAGLRVARNTPFAGAYVAQTYGRPALGQSVIQIEIDRSLYMDEARVTPSAGFESFRRLMAGVVPRLVALGALPAALAAE